MNIPTKNKKAVLEKLENITSNVSKKPIYVVKKDGESYSVIHYISKKILISDVPFAKPAKNLANDIHKFKKVNPEKIKRLTAYIDSYYKHYNDAIFYKHTLKTTKDPEKFEIVEARLDMTLAYLRCVRDTLANF